VLERVLTAVQDWLIISPSTL